ncbi:MAG: hypothetical protein Q8P50_02350 [Bacillota bacterium]|nr:hypothetical protein [Bacillota bacterium]
MNIFERLGTADRRWWFLALAIVVGIPVMKPLGLPTSVSDWARQFQAAVNTLQAGDVVLMSTSYTASGSPDVHPGAQVVFRVLMRENVKVVLVSFTEQGDAFADMLVQEQISKGKQYGVDFVNIGFIAGQETAVAGFAANVTGLVPRDYRGNPLADMPILQGINTAADFAMTALVATGTPGCEEWTRQITGPYKIPALMIYTTNGATRVIPYLQAGQVAGLLIGMRGAAEFEVLERMPGSASAGMDAQSLGHLFMLMLIILANMAQLSEWQKKKAKAQAKEASRR